MNDYRNDLEKLKIELQKAGIKKGDIVYISSDITVLLFLMSTTYNKKKYFIDRFLNDFVNLFIKAVGEEGTVLFPVFSWDFCKGKGFDIRKTKGEVGTLSNWVLINRRDFSRTRHPIYSFMVSGKEKPFLTGLDNQDAWGKLSPFSFLKEKNAIQVLFNIEAYQGLTFGHYVEQCIKVPYRHHKYFFGKYTDERGNSEIRSYSMYVRDLNVECDCGIQNDFLVKKGVANNFYWMNNSITMVALGECYPILEEDMLKNAGRNTLRFSDGKVLDWDNDWGNREYEISNMPMA